ncbi:MAG: TetR/AcrR family transcriptional regulator [Dehalococcoidia bacterium]
MPKVTEAHLEARRQQILDAAWACFARKGYYQTTMQDICKESGLSPGAIYRYFTSKEAIRTAVFDRQQEWARDVLETARSQAGQPRDTLEVIGQTMWLSYFNDPAFETMARVEIENWPEALRDKELLDNHRKNLTFWRTLVTQLLTEAKKVGQLRADVDPASLASLFICAHQGLLHLRLVDPDNFQPERLFELMLGSWSEERSVKLRRKGRTKARVQR